MSDKEQYAVRAVARRGFASQAGEILAERYEHFAIAASIIDSKMYIWFCVILIPETLKDKIESRNFVRQGYIKGYADFVDGISPTNWKLSL